MNYLVAGSGIRRLDRMTNDEILYERFRMAEEAIGLNCEVGELVENIGGWNRREGESE